MASISGFVGSTDFFLAPSHVTSKVEWLSKHPGATCTDQWLFGRRFIQQPTHREVIWIVGQQGGEGKTFLQNYIKYYYSDRRVIATDIATSTKDIAYFLSKFPLECEDIFLFNHPCSTAETVAYDMLEGIKDGHQVSAKYDTRRLFFKTPNTVIVFSNEFPKTEALKKDRWSIYEIIGEELYHKNPSTSKPSRLSSIPHKIRQPKYYHYYWYRVKPRAKVAQWWHRLFKYPSLCPKLVFKNWNA